MATTTPEVTDVDHTPFQRRGAVVGVGVARRALPAGAGAFVIVGGTAVVAGGFAAAAISEAPTPHGSWAVAYLVLVVGVAQALLGVAQAALFGSVGNTWRSVELALWQVGSAGVLVGVLARTTATVDVGSGLLLAALGCFAFVRGRRGSCASGALGASYLVLIVVLGLSMIAGALLARSMRG